MSRACHPERGVGAAPRPWAGAPAIGNDTAMSARVIQPARNVRRADRRLTCCVIAGSEEWVGMADVLSFGHHQSERNGAPVGPAFDRPVGRAERHLAGDATI